MKYLREHNQERLAGFQFDRKLMILVWLSPVNCARPGSAVKNIAAHRSVASQEFVL